MAFCLILSFSLVFYGTVLGQHLDESAGKVENSTISQRKCREYAEFVFEYHTRPLSTTSQTERIKVDGCGNDKVLLIPVGDHAFPREFPHMALLGYEDDNNIAWLCSGSLISDQYVLTAAHCLHSPLQSQPKYVLLGEVDLESENEDETSSREHAKAERFGISKLFAHPDYKYPSVYNDIGPIKLDKKVKLSPDIRPACLPTVFEEPDKRAILLGWGLADRMRPGPQRLMKQILEKFSHEECNSTYSSRINRRMPEGIRDQTQICYGSRIMTKGGCISESGSPLQVYHKDIYCMQTIIGVTSFGAPCNTQNLPEVHSRVYSYLDWIEKTVWGER
ncbi:unnamed protein product [Hermetia illucens]|uniref:Peptidase S1 domain-containing protein n=1 Tax=Hermetia illucens TaxID=343691 RepID=A0A7R8V516_HERIL|nr:unnamed protein product [Hermetia illucens]